MSPSTFPLPGVQHGQRILASVVESRALEGPGSTWASVPIDDNNITRGFRDISYDMLNNAANHAAHWLRKHLPEAMQPFRCFAYAGPKDLRYPVLAVAAAKLQQVMVLPSPLITAEAQLQVLDKKGCRVYLRAAAMADKVDEVVQLAPDMQVVTVPELGEFMQEGRALSCVYPKTWDEGKGDPWLVFHTSGTTGNPRPVTYTQEMMAWPDRVAALPDVEESLCHQLANSRWHTPLPSLHLVGTMFVLSMPAYLNMVAVIGPSRFPSPDDMVQILEKGETDGILAPPAIIDAMCRISSALDALRRLKYVYYAGAPLSAKSAGLLTPYTTVAPAIGSTEGGAYFTKISRNNGIPYDYIAFHDLAGAVFEHRYNDLYELVFLRQPDPSMQQIFSVHPDRDRYETNDLWVEHPSHKGYWKIVGRTDDYIYLSHGDGLHASLLEPEIEAHPAVRAALIGGHGRPAPVLIVQLYGEYEGVNYEETMDSLRPHIERVNSRCHDCVKLSLERVIFASKEKPFVQTVKGSVARSSTLALYEDEIEDLFS